MKSAETVSFTDHLPLIELTDQMKIFFLPILMIKEQKQGDWDI